MMVKSHVVLGLAAWAAAAPLLHRAALDPTLLALAVAGALLPDVDHPQSWVGRRTRPLSTLIGAMFGHRGLTHSALAVLGGAVLLVQIGTRHGAVAALAVGYLSHLAADMLTPRGLRLAWPLRRSWGLKLCRSGSLMEPVVVLALVLGVGWWRFGR